MTKLYAILAGVAVSGLLAGSWLAVTRDAESAFAQCRDSSIAGGTSAIGGPFELVSEAGLTVTDAEIITKPTLIYFGYTYCPDVCPLDAARNADAVDLLAEQGHDAQSVFITIDPERDTPAVLAEFTDYLHPQMIGLTGSVDQIKAASQTYKTYFAKRNGDDPDFYLMDHSVFTYLVLPEQGFVEFFRGAPGGAGAGVEAEELAAKAACFIEAA